jgi:hypothetical protein
MRFVKLAVIVVCLSLSGFACAGESQNIPLDKIWAYKMPGTRGIQELDKARPKGSGRSLVALISESWVLRADDLKGKDLARPGFAVAGTGLSALQFAHTAFEKGTKPRELFSPNEEVTIVFFSELAGGNRVQIRQVDRRESRVVIRYCLEPNVGGYRALNLALIPLGKLPVGKYDVEMCQLPREKKYVELGFKPLGEEWSRQFLCTPFSFTVTEKSE